MSEFLSDQTQPRYATHVTWLINNLGEKLEKAFARENVDINLTDAMDAFLAADPSQNKRAVDWLVKTYLNRGFLWEDVAAGIQSKAFDTLQRFATYRSRLVGGARNLHEYEKLTDVWQSIKNFVIQDNDISNRTTKKLEKQQVLSETTVLFRDETMIVAIPLTERSSKWWGKGTRWCTAAENSNYFDNYNNQAPLIVFTFPRGLPFEKEESKSRKLQLWFTRQEQQSDFCNYAFMDEDDNQVGLDCIQRNWPIFKPILELAREKNPKIISFFPAHEITQEMYDRAVENDPQFLFSVPEEFLNQENCRNALKEDSSVVSHVPQQFLNKEMCDLALSKNISIIHYFKSEWITDDHLVEYIASRSFFSASSQAIPQERITHDIILQAVKKNPECIQYAPQKYITDEICILCIEQGLPLSCIPKESITLETCMIAADKNPDNIYSIPEHLWNEEIASFATKSEHWCATPEAFKTKEFYSQLIRNLNSDQNLLFKLPTRILKDFDQETFDICLEKFACSSIVMPKARMRLEDYVKNSKCSGFQLNWVPKKWRAKVFDSMPDERIGSLTLDALATRERTRKVCSRAVKANSFNISSVPPKFLNDEILGYAINKTCVLIEEERLKEFLTPDLLLIAFNQGYYSLGKIDEKLKTKEVCLAALKNMDVNITHVPAELLTESFYREAYAIAPGIIRFVENREDIKQTVLDRYWQDKTTVSRIPEQWITKDIIEDLKECLINGEIPASSIPPYLLTREFVDSVEGELADSVEDHPESLSEQIHSDKLHCVWSDQVLDELKQVLSSTYVKDQVGVQLKL